eukprot:1143850-Pelagomonas_calceolata.AAC.5
MGFCMFCKYSLKFHQCLQNGKPFEPRADHHSFPAALAQMQLSNMLPVQGTSYPGYVWSCKVAFGSIHTPVDHARPPLQVHWIAAAAAAAVLA